MGPITNFFPPSFEVSGIFRNINYIFQIKKIPKLHFVLG